MDVLIAEYHNCRHYLSENGVDSPHEKGELEGVTRNIIRHSSSMQKKIERIQMTWKKICGFFSDEKNSDTSFIAKNQFENILQTFILRVCNSLSRLMEKVILKN